MLVAWYARNQRDLPWRRCHDPYRVWVSEVLLQQTRVDQAIPYFHRFVDRFPDLFSLARARQSEVLKVCEGMGYYARARNLHKAARQLVDERKGRIPDTLEELLELPGIGPNTAHALLSIGFDRPYPVVDGNVRRILSRLVGLGGDLSKQGRSQLLWTIARELLPVEGPATFNQAMMDLGALICLPRKPQCEKCPVLSFCYAFQSGDAEAYPEKRPRKSKPHYDVSAGVIMNGARILITRRFPEGLLGGLWEFPGGKREEGETLEACLLREIQEELSVTIDVGPSFLTVNREYSHFRITLHSFLCRLQRGEPQKIGCSDLRWVTIGQLGDFAFPRADRKIIEKLNSTNPFTLMPN
ncbi:MAG: A/G-specific adenine glycosylase [Deltaproteobacteria bacterium]|nr:A/G-specific adenine glycosylase [Deltaproteobacteria bacterium]